MLAKLLYNHEGNPRWSEKHPLIWRNFMLRNHIPAVFILLLALVSTLQAQEVSQRVLLLPVDVRGSQESLTSTQITGFIESAAEAEAPGVDIVLPSRLLRASNAPPSLDDARALLEEYNADSVAWLTVRFREQSLPTSDAYLQNLTLSAAARMWVFSGSKDQVVLDEPVSVVRQTPLSASVGVSTQAAAMQDLKYSCGTELASSLVHIALEARKKNLVGGWQEAGEATATTTAGSRRFLSAFSAYQKAVGNSDFVAAAAAQTDSRQAWANLSASEKAALEKQYPGLLKWLGE